MISQPKAIGLATMVSLAGQLLIGLVVSDIQVCSLYLGFHASSVSDPVQGVLMSIMGIPFNAGGYTVRAAFEVLVGDRTTTVMSNLPFYLTLLLLQMALVTAIVAARFRRTGTLKDWILVAVAILLAANGLANIMWPW